MGKDFDFNKLGSRSKLGTWLPFSKSH